MVGAHQHAVGRLERPPPRRGTAPRTRRRPGRRRPSATWRRRSGPRRRGHRLRRGRRVVEDGPGEQVHRVADLVAGPRVGGWCSMFSITPTPRSLTPILASMPYSVTVSTTRPSGIGIVHVNQPSRHRVVPVPGLHGDRRTARRQRDHRRALGRPVGFAATSSSVRAFTEASSRTRAPGALGDAGDLVGVPRRDPRIACQARSAQRSTSKGRPWARSRRAGGTSPRSGRSRREVPAELDAAFVGRQDGGREGRGHGSHASPRGRSAGDADQQPAVDALGAQLPAGADRVAVELAGSVAVAADADRPAGHPVDRGRRCACPSTARARRAGSSSGTGWGAAAPRRAPRRRSPRRAAAACRPGR